LIVTIFVAMTFNFFLPRLMPGNPVEAMYARYANTPEQLKSLTQLYLKNQKPLFEQYIDYLGNTLRGNFGISLSNYPTPVIQKIGSALPWTIGLLGTSLIISFLLGTFWGIYCAWNRISFLGTLSPIIGEFLYVVPFFFFGLVMIYIFGYLLNWFPMSGGYSILASNQSQYIFSVIHHAILPSTTLVLSSIGGWMLLMRNNMISTLSEDYITFSFAQGIPKRIIEYQYAARNAILPSFTNFAISIGYLVGGAVIVEEVFSYPGIGNMLYESISNLDYPLMQGIFLIVVVSVVVANFLADLFYVLLDPRIKR